MDSSNSAEFVPPSATLAPSAASDADFSPPASSPVPDSAMQQQLDMKIAELEDQLSPAAKAEKRKALLEEAWRQKLLIINSSSNADDAQLIAFLTGMLREQLSETMRAQWELDGAKAKAASEKVTLQQQLLKATTHRDKLDSLCRELQKKNKSLTEEMRTLTESQHRNHTELKRRFETGIADISQKMNSYSDERVKLLEENAALRDKVQQLLNIDEVKEKHWAQQLKTKNIELELSDAKFRHSVEQLSQQTRRAQIYKDKLEEVAQSEHQLKAQIEGYNERFKEVQEALNRSNQVFTEFKAQLDTLTAQLARKEKEKLALEKEKLTWERKYSQSQLSVLESFEKSKKDAAELDKTRRQKQQLEHLCKLMEKDKAKLKEELAATTDRLKQLVPDYKYEPRPAAPAPEPSAVPVAADHSAPSSGSPSADDTQAENGANQETRSGRAEQ